tara:strand:- start:794 stop:1606 length:813 start_codon:yes stop_codon:yes gene_type:complete
MAPTENIRPPKSLDTMPFNKLLEDYEFTIARTSEERNRALFLRHEVFLQEFNYEMTEDQTKNFEIDDYDTTSIHCLIEHKRSGMLAGCMRLVMPSADTSSKLSKLPVEIQGDGKLNHDTFHPGLMPKQQTCEVSRLAISRRFRARQKTDTPVDNAADGKKFTLEEEKTFPLIAIGLFLCTYSLVGLSKKRHVFAMMDARLPRLLALSGFYFTKVSEAIEYHGSRYAFYIDHTKAEKEMHKDLMPFYLHIRQTLAPQLEELLAAQETSAVN